MTSAVELERALQEVWDAPAPPEYIVMNTHTYETFHVVSEELRLLREVTTPRGLARLFPALKSWKKPPPS